MDALPREIIPEILSCLPVESLFRLKTLNKSWYFFIRCLVKDPEFVSKHFRHAESSPTLLLVRKLLEEKNATLDEEYGSNEFQVLKVQFGIGDDDSVHCIVKDFNLPRCLSVVLDHSMDEYICNGIVCIVAEGWTTFNLYNPALGEFDSFSPSSRFNLDTNEMVVMGFGCDSTGSVYKVVRFFELEDMKAEVFVPGGPRNSWREIDMGIEQLEFHLLEFKFSHVYLKGNCFWSMDDRILCFEVGREVFHNIPLPEEAADHSLYGFGRCNSSIFVILGSGDVTCVWLLDVSCCRGGFGYSWRKKSQIAEFSKCARLFWDVDRGEVLVTNKDEEIESYNMFDEKVRSVPFRLTWKELYLLEHYVTSLVTIKSLNKARAT